MSLNEKLRRIREAGDAKRPPQYTAVMKRATADLRASGAADRALRVGDPVPPFELPRVGGDMTSLRSLLSSGPAVISFFRGRW